ncbi:hypothetical protein GF359_03315 [candidate division WOR-3 bacterium]|uniref:Uncharacterized protein n=1 Tax=candidate division WOR-3 bacterium TaxID=2052148 RepID=A0A9D5K8T6_UNCW3|nr:hypothetical protein [candidate division WOR-3 bacterium]MBD3364224.1 hypothetical protein [candidate division WOR-3 bacterium]
MKTRFLTGALKVRGLMYAAASRWTAEQFGDDKLEKFLETLPDEYRNILNNYDKKEWYPAKGAFIVYDHLITFLADVMTETEVFEGITNFMFPQAITGFMKGLLSFLTPARLTRRATSF